MSHKYFGAGPVEGWVEGRTQTWDAPPIAILAAPFSPAHYAFVQIASAMAYADNTWGEADLYSVMEHFGLEGMPNWKGQQIPDRTHSRNCALQALQTIMDTPDDGADKRVDPELRERARRLVWYFR